VKGPEIPETANLCCKRFATFLDLYELLHNYAAAL